MIYDSIRKLQQIRLDLDVSWQIYPQYYYQARQAELQKDALMVLTTEVPIVVNNPKALLVSKLLLSTDIELVNLYLSGCLKKETQKRLLEATKKYFLPTIQVLDKTDLFDLLSNEEIGDYRTYDLVLANDIGYFAAFTEKSRIQVYELIQPILYKDHFLKKIVVANYHVGDNDLHEFYQVVRTLLGKP